MDNKQVYDYIGAVEHIYDSNQNILVTVHMEQDEKKKFQRNAQTPLSSLPTVGKHPQAILAEHRSYGIEL